MAKYVFGVDVGGTTVKMGLFTVEGELLDKWEIKTRTEDGGKNVLPDIADSIKEVIESKKLAKEDVEGVGIGVPGPVKEDGTVLKCVNLGWGILNVEDELEKLIGYPVKAGNDANVAALGEMWQGGGKGHSNLVMVTLGTGVGGGIILNGKMLFGVNASLVLDMPLMLFVMAFLTIPALATKKLHRYQGIVLLCIYAAFCVIQFTM